MDAIRRICDSEGIAAVRLTAVVTVGAVAAAVWMLRDGDERWPWRLRAALLAVLSPLFFAWPGLFRVRARPAPGEPCVDLASRLPAPQAPAGHGDTLQSCVLL